MRPIPTLYIPVPSPFPVLETFIAETATKYNLDLFLCQPPDEYVENVPTASIPALPATLVNGDGVGVDYLNTQGKKPRTAGKAKGAESMRRALEIYKTGFPCISAILVGMRRTDPHGGMNLFSYVTDR